MTRQPRRYPFMQVDAFTNLPLTGNACAVVFDAGDLDAITMRAIAQEMALSETAFVLSLRKGGARVRYFTPAEEIPFAGHPTIATVWALLESGRLPTPVEGPSPPRVTLELKDGPVHVEVADREDGRRLTMTQRKPEFLRTYPASDVAGVFGLRIEDVRSDVPIQTVSTGTPQLMVPIVDLAALRRATLDIRAYEALKAGGDFFSPHLFCLGGATPAGATFARHFGVPPDVLEDPFTGSATGGMAAYLWHHGVLDQPIFVAEQGHWLARPGTGYVEVLGPREAIDAIRVGGTAVTTARGELLL